VRIEGARIIDFAPTILHPFGVEVPSDIYGRVLEGSSPRSTARTPVRLSEAIGLDYDAGDKSPAMTEEESEEIRARLRGLGYLG
jgi:hypothetical protein